LNDETISALGMFCTDMLSSEPFQALVQMYSQQCAVDILKTEPHELKKREQLYASYRGFEGFLALAKQFAAGHEQITTEKTAAASAPDLFDDPSVHDIYDGLN
jgi:hypothetical protein